MSKGLYIQMHSMHGLFRGHDPELGQDEDTGGQIIYVLDLAKAFGELDGIDKVDILTRRIEDPEYPGYSEKVEGVTDKVSIVRIPCGGGKYLKKVDLWPHLEEFVRNTTKYIDELGHRPDILHSNYADSGYVCTLLSKELNIPQVHTGHSLGKPKMERLSVSDENYAEMDAIYHFTERIQAEEEVIKNASAIITSTNEERLHQYGMYPVSVEDSRFHVVPPGIDVDVFNLSGSGMDHGSYERIKRILIDSFADPDKPIVLALSRLDYRKNLISLVKAFALDKELEEMSNLAVFVGRFGKFGKAQEILLDEIENLIQNQNIEDSVCLPNEEIDFEREVPVLYHIIAEERGVFVNPALIEPFGLTILEAAASGVPVVATQNGGPSEIITDGVNGFLIEPRNHCEIAEKIKKILSNPGVWDEFSRKGRDNVLKRYTWERTAEKEFEIFKEILDK